MRKILMTAIVSIMVIFAASAFSADAELESISKELSNPVSSLRNFPLRYDYDAGIDPLDGTRSTLRIQPIFSVPISGKWSLMSRTVIPIINQTMGSTTSSGISDIQESLYFSTKSSKGVTYGFGPIVLIPTATDFSSDMVGLGPAGIVLAQPGKWTIGALVNHIWSAFGGGHPGDGGYFSITTIQPLIVYHLPEGWSLNFNTEASYDWKAENYTVPLTFQVGKVQRIGGQTFSFSIAGKYFLPEDNQPEWGIRSVLTYVFPKK